MSDAALQPSETASGDQPSSQELIRDLIANELVFAVVGPVGSGTSEIADTLETLLSAEGYKATDLLPDMSAFIS